MKYITGEKQNKSLGDKLSAKKPFTSKRLYKILSGVMVVCWAIIITLGVGTIVARKFFYPIKYQNEIVGYADKYGLDRTLIFAVCRVESSFNQGAVSKAGAVGIMQITPSTAEYIAKNLGLENYDITSLATNLDFGCYYLKYLLAKFPVQNTALCAYNAGEGKVSEWLKDKSLSTDGKTLKKIPYEESKNFVKRVNKSLHAYRKLYKNILDKEKKFS